MLTEPLYPAPPRLAVARSRAPVSTRYTQQKSVTAKHAEILRGMLKRPENKASTPLIVAEPLARCRTRVGACSTAGLATHSLSRRVYISDSLLDLCSSVQTASATVRLQGLLYAHIRMH